MLAGGALPSRWRTGPAAGGWLERYFEREIEGWEVELARSATTNSLRNFLDALAAVLAGNAIYFLLMPHLPVGMRHSLFREDWGLLLDFVICTIIFIGVKIIRR
jgi:hypothetical protein